METGNVFEIKVTKVCRKQIDRAPRHIQQAVENALKKITVSPCGHSEVKALTGDWAGRYRYRTGNYRMIYIVEDDIVTIIVVAFGSRGDIYK